MLLSQVRRIIESWLRQTDQHLQSHVMIYGLVIQDMWFLMGQVRWSGVSVLSESLNQGQCQGRYWGAARG